MAGATTVTARRTTRADMSPRREPMFIGEAASLLGVSAKALRLYERLGLLRPPLRTASGYRVYSRSNLGRLRVVLWAGSTAWRFRQPAHRPTAHPFAERAAGSGIATGGVNWTSLPARDAPSWATPTRGRGSPLDRPAGCLLDRVGAVGEYPQHRLRALQTRRRALLDGRGCGLMVGVELAGPDAAARGVAVSRALGHSEIDLAAQA